MDAEAGLRGKTYAIVIQGCRTNQYEGEALAAALEQSGAVRCDERPDIAVVVTCTITAVADRKCRKLLRRLRRKRRPDHPGRDVGNARFAGRAVGDAGLRPHGVRRAVRRRRGD